MIALAPVLLVVCAAAPLELTDHGAAVQKLEQAELLKQQPAVSVEVFEPHRDAKVGYRGIALQPLLDRVYGARWRKADTLLIRCADGYKPAVPVAKVIASKAFLAFAMTDGSPFHMRNEKQNEDVDLGPFYLVWEDTPETRADGGADWPYQIVGIDLANFTDAFPKLAPPQNASAPAKQGFLIFQRRCVPCHTINGEGGAKAPELNYPVNVTEYWRKDMLRKWIDAPTKLRFSTAMPALDSTVPDRAKAIDALIAYLEAMKGRKVAPAQAAP